MSKLNDLCDTVLTIVFHYLELSPPFRLRKPSLLLGLVVEISREWCSVLNG